MPCSSTIRIAGAESEDEREMKVDENYCHFVLSTFGHIFHSVHSFLRLWMVVKERLRITATKSE